jgi:hypothetical protein
MMPKPAPLVFSGEWSEPMAGRCHPQGTLIHAVQELPGSHYWNDDNEWPTGDFGFVWGCVWGDDTSWKVQYLDLSRVQQGEIKRDERFGYVELATITPDPRDFIRVYGTRHIMFAVDRTYNLATGKCLDKASNGTA